MHGFPKCEVFIETFQVFPKIKVKVKRVQVFILGWLPATVLQLANLRQMVRSLYPSSPSGFPLSPLVLCFIFKAVSGHMTQKITNTTQTIVCNSETGRGFFPGAR